MRSSKKRRKAVKVTRITVAIGVLVGVCFFGFEKLNRSDQKFVDFDVEPGVAGGTLRELARQASVPFVAGPGLDLGFETPAVRGRFTPLEAFNELLGGSDLYVVHHEEIGTYLLRSSAEEPLAVEIPHPR